MHINKNQPLIRLSPSALLIHGLLILPAFLLQDFLLFRVIQTALFFLLSFFGKNSVSENKKRIIFFFISFLSIVAVNIFAPHGEVLFKIFSFPITRQAISIGILKATTFTGLLALSRITIMKNLTISGPIGGMVGKVFYYFEKLKEIQGKYKSKDIFKRIDLILMEMTTPANTEYPKGKQRKEYINWVGVLLICVSVVFHWGLLGVSSFIV